jgi:EAL domain-containing protein (putative c-di-GMP-specific phosphodiesterase class I)
VAESPFTIGRRSDVSLHLPSPAVSGLHAEIIEREGLLRLRDLKSTNGSFVNGELVRGERALDEDDLVQFGDVTLRVGRRSVGRSDVAVVESVWDEELARARFDELFDKRAVACDFQPIVELANLKPAAFQALPRSRLFGLSKPSELFETAAHFDHEAELYELLRYEAVAAGRELPGRPELFVSMHRRELDLPEQLAASLELLRREFPEPPLALEVHEAEVTDAEAVLRLRAALGDLGVRLVYGGFGANCSRLVELAQMPPDVLAFDMAFIRCIHAAGEKRQKMLTALVRTARELGITTLATGVEIEPESETCRQLGFDLAQGHLFGKPAGPASWDTEQAVR